VKATSAKTKRQLTEKRINNILAVLSKALHYAARVRLIPYVPEIGLYKVERPEIECWDFAEYSRVLAAAQAYGPEWYAAMCLAGEAGLRVGEVKALRWREDVDLVARTVTVNQQVRHKAVSTPKGRTRRTIPMTRTLYDALAALAVVRTGFVIRNLDGTMKTDEQARYALDAIYVKAGLPSRGWHILRHSFGTHAALLGVNPWRLQAWMGHKRIDETMLYVHVAEAHHRPIPSVVSAAAASEADPDRRVLAMLGARKLVPASEALPGDGASRVNGNLTATEEAPVENRSAFQ
jgi:integrase